MSLPPVVTINLVEWEVFVGGRSEPISGGQRKMTRAHTNIPRSGLNGLPRDWEMDVLNWHASVNLPMEQVVLDWACETAVVFQYNERYCGQTTLAELLTGSRRLGVDSLPVHMREQLTYFVKVSVENARAYDALCAWLRRDDLVRVRDELADLRSELRDQANPKTVLGRIAGNGVKILSSAIEDLQVKPRELICWIHLEGMIQKVVVGA